MPDRPSPRPRSRRTPLLVLLAAGCVLVSGCGAAGPSAAPEAASSSASSAEPSTSSAGPSTSSAGPSTAPTTAPSASPSAAPTLQVSDGKPRKATLSIAKIDLEDLEVEPYKGSPDDAPGTKIQDGGIAASPFGPKGGVGPGGVGNYIVTGHRSSSTKPFQDLPDLKVGEKVQVVADGQRYTYRIVATRITSFRSKKSLAAQRAEVPGRPGVKATKAMITVSTCRTPEDRAEGNFWSDKFHNPENRIDKIGELVATRPV